jgi:hypothetical protein
MGMMMNSYFKTPEEITSLFQKAFEALKYFREAAAKTSESLKAARKDLLLNKPDLRV